MRHALFTLSVVAAAAVAIAFPAVFTEVAGVKLVGLVKPLLMVTMFGVGATMGWRDFAAVAANPRGVAVGLLLQFTVMPLVGFALSRAFALPPEVAAGVVLIGCVPSGLASNVIAFIAKANVPLSVTLTACATLMGPLVTPALMKLLGGTLVEIDAAKMTWEMVQIVILPIGVGLLLNQALGRHAKYLHAPLPLVSMTGIAVIVGIITAAGRENLIHVGAALVVCVVAHNLFGFALGYAMGRLSGLDVQDARTVSIEVGMQNGGLASALAIQMGKGATTALAPVLFATIMSVNGSLLAAYWARRAGPAAEPADEPNELQPEPV